MRWIMLVPCAAALAFAVPAPAHSQETPAAGLERALAAAERALDSGEHELARLEAQRALERDPKSPAAWRLCARSAEALEDTDDLVYSLHRLHGLLETLGAPAAELEALRGQLAALDPVSRELLDLERRFVGDLAPIAAGYEEEGRPHAAIRVHKQILALDPENAESRAAIERIASAPDPSLAEHAKPRDLFADVSEEWIAEFDAEHAEWKDRAKLEKGSYVTHTNAGYRAMVLTSEAMEQMNAFYREFFQHGTDEHGGSVPRIDVRIFKNRDDYLKFGSGPKEWSGGQFTGSAVETYVPGTFQDMTGTLFHEAAHQFVSIATNASGWLNEGLASFFEGTRLLPNGTVIMNLPAGGRLFALASRMELGWMEDHTDGIDGDQPSARPLKAPRFATVLENRYTWGPPWYAPTWGVVYFLYNYQDPRDGRYVYRKAFREFMNKSGGRVGEGAVSNFEELVLASPAPPFKGVDAPEDDAVDFALPSTVEELEEVWRRWILDLRDEVAGRRDVKRDYLRWGLAALENDDLSTAREHFEKGLLENPHDVELALGFARLAEKLGNLDRAEALVLGALQELERAEERDEKTIADSEKWLAKLNPDREALDTVHESMAAAARSIVQRYEAAGLPSMVMDVSWRLAAELGVPDLFDAYERAVRDSGRSLGIWSLAYDESSLEGWGAQGEDGVFHANGTSLDARFGEFDEEDFAYRILTLDEVTSGDFSLSAEVRVAVGKVTFAGFAFGRKDARNFHALLLFPGRATRAEGAAETGYVDLTTFYGSGDEFEVWRHVPVDTSPPEGQSVGELWFPLRLDVSGRFADLWFDGELIASHEFQSLDVLRGSFGIATGKGEASFRNVRYLARDPRDPAAQIERAIRLEELRAGGAVGGSWLGQVPPFPDVQRWVQGERASWAEQRGKPQLLAFFSTDQNRLVRIDEWLMDLYRRTRDVGLEFVCVASPNDLDKLEGYLAEHAFPGAVGVDARETEGIGESFETFAIDRFNLPRLLLLDLDGTVVWEGDPGFKAGVAPSRPYKTFLDDPLEALIARRKLRSLQSWNERWNAVGREALAAGDVASVLELATEAREFDRRYAEEAGWAQSQLAAVEATVGALETSFAALSDQGADPAAPVLLDWAELCGVDVPRKRERALLASLDEDVIDAWDETQEDVARYLKNRKEPPEKAGELLDRLTERTGPFPAALREDLAAAQAEGDWERFEEIARAAKERPRLWLAGEFFGW